MTRAVAETCLKPGKTEAENCVVPWNTTPSGACGRQAVVQGWRHPGEPRATQGRLLPFRQTYVGVSQFGGNVRGGLGEFERD